MRRHTHAQTHAHRKGTYYTEIALHILTLEIYSTPIGTPQTLAHIHRNLLACIHTHVHTHAKYAHMQTLAIVRAHVFDLPPSLMPESFS
jgi:hypothetical protein